MNFSIKRYKKFLSVVCLLGFYTCLHAQEGIQGLLQKMTNKAAEMVGDAVEAGVKGVRDEIEYQQSMNERSIERITEAIRALAMEKALPGTTPGRINIIDVEIDILKDRLKELRQMNQSLDNAALETVKQMKDMMFTALNKKIALAQELETFKKQEAIRAKTAQDVEAVKGLFGLKRAQEMLRFAADPKKMAVPAAAGLALIGGYQAAKLGRRVAEAYIRVPKLIKESSIGWFGRRKKQEPSKLHLFVGSPELKGKIQGIIDRSKIALARDEDLANIVFYGPPGTGKTMIATEIAKNSGMDYAIFSAGDFGKMSPQDAKNRLDQIFDWADSLAKRGRKLVIFVDEAEQFLINLGLKQATLKQKELQGIFLSRVPEQRSKKFMFVFATNYPELIVGGAAGNRISEWIEFDLPGIAERKKLFETYLQDQIRAKGIKLDDKVEQSIVNEFSKDSYTAGFAGREIKGLVGMFKDKAFKDGKLTYETAQKVMKQMEMQKAIQRKMIDIQKKRYGEAGFVTKRTAAAGG